MYKIYATVWVTTFTVLGLKHGIDTSDFRSLEVVMGVIVTSMVLGFLVAKERL